VPYAHIAKDIQKFVDAQYYPAGLRIREPRNMIIDEIVQFVTTIKSRQELLPIAQVFRFKNVQKGRKTNELIRTQYPDEEQIPVAAPVKRKPKRKGPTTRDLRLQKEMEDILTFNVNTLNYMFLVLT
jgi:hypothetical protein